MNTERKLRLIRTTCWILQHWLIIFLVFFGLLNLLPFLAPVLAKLGIQPLANAIYVLYAPLCHQMAHRSFFLFGDQLMYHPEQIPVEFTSDLSANILALRQFTGNEAIGWKVAWSDRMVYMYGATWIFAAIYAVAPDRYKAKRLSLPTFALLMLPMVVDGTTHMFSDFDGGLFAGFRYTNEWLANLTSYTLPTWFYTGDTFGSFNSWMRLISGIGFGAGIIGIGFPLIASELHHSHRMLIVKLQKHKNPSPGKGEENRKAHYPTP